MLSSLPYIRQAKILERTTASSARDTAPLHPSRHDCDVRATDVGNVFGVPPAYPNLLHIVVPNNHTVQYKIHGAYELRFYASVRTLVTSGTLMQTHPARTGENMVN